MYSSAYALDKQHSPIPVVKRNFPGRANLGLQSRNTLADRPYVVEIVVRMVYSIIPQDWDAEVRQTQLVKPSISW